MSKLDQLIPKLAYKNRHKWFQDENLWEDDFDTFFENYHKMIQTDKKNNGKECIRFNLPYSLENTVYNENNILLSSLSLDPLQEIAFSQYRIVLLLRLKGIWIVEEAYGLSWDVCQIKLFPPKNNLPKGCKFLEFYSIKDHTPGKIIFKDSGEEKNIFKTNEKVTEEHISQNELETTLASDKPKLVNYLMKDE